MYTLKLYRFLRGSFDKGGIVKKFFMLLIPCIALSMLFHVTVYSNEGVTTSLNLVLLSSGLAILCFAASNLLRGNSRKVQLKWRLHSLYLRTGLSRLSVKSPSIYCYHTEQVVLLDKESRLLIARLLGRKLNIHSHYSYSELQQLLPVNMYKLARKAAIRGSIYLKDQPLSCELQLEKQEPDLFMFSIRELNNHLLNATDEFIKNLLATAKKQDLLVLVEVGHAESELHEFWLNKDPQKQKYHHTKKVLHLPSRLLEEAENDFLLLGNVLSLARDCEDKLITPESHPYFFYDKTELTRHFQCQRFNWHHQPIVGQQSGLYGIELLLRDSKGKLTPADILRIVKLNEAEDVMLEALLRAAHQYVKVLRKAGKTNVRLFLNIELDNLNSLLQLLANIGLEQDFSRHLVFEITEKTDNLNLKYFQPQLLQLKAKGCLIYLDDFLEGNSELSMAEEYLVDGIKLDVGLLSANAHLLPHFNLLMKPIVLERVEFEQQLKICENKELATCNFMIQGYVVSKPKSMTDLNETIIAVEQYFQRSNKPVQPIESVPQKKYLASLTQKELLIMELLSSGKSNTDISLALSIGYSTVSWHLKNIYRKLGVSTRGEAVSLFLKGAY